MFYRMPFHQTDNEIIASILFISSGISKNELDCGNNQELQTCYSIRKIPVVLQGHSHILSEFFSLSLFNVGTLHCTAFGQKLRTKGEQSDI